MHKLTRILIYESFLDIDSLQRIKRNMMWMRNGLDEACPAARCVAVFSPAERYGGVPAGPRLAGRQQSAEARKQLSARV